MLHLLAHTTILADGISIRIGDNVWSFGLNFIIYLIIAALVGFLQSLLSDGNFHWVSSVQ